MDSLLEKLISEFNLKTDNQQKQIKKYLELLKEKGGKVVDSSKLRLEIKKIEYEIKREHKKIGEYVSKKYMKSEVVDFTYDEDLLSMLEQIKKINFYLKSLKKYLNN